MTPALSRPVDEPCDQCGRVTPIMHHTLVPRRTLCDDCCAPEHRRRAISQEVVDILSKD